jgi:hypothetical protein
MHLHSPDEHFIKLVYPRRIIVSEPEECICLLGIRGVSAETGE